MTVIGGELLKTRPVWLKFIFNDTAIVFSHAGLQHREITGAGLSYQDEGGNALAGMIVNSGIEIRGHSILKPDRNWVRECWLKVREVCPDPYLHSLSVSFQGVRIGTNAG